MAVAETVTVACRLPNGLTCRVFAKHTEYEPMPSGVPREVIRWYPTGKQFVLNGCAREAGHLPRKRRADGYVEMGSHAPVLDTGFALTHNVPKELWDLWYEQNKHQPFVENGLVFAHKQQASLTKMGKERENQRSGLEPIDPMNPAPGIEPTDEQKKRRYAA